MGSFSLSPCTHCGSFSWFGCVVRMHRCELESKRRTSLAQRSGNSQSLRDQKDNRGGDGRGQRAEPRARRDRNPGFLPGAKRERRNPRNQLIATVRGLRSAATALLGQRPALCRCNRSTFEGRTHWNTFFSRRGQAFSRLSLLRNDMSRSQTITATSPSYSRNSRNVVAMRKRRL